MLEFTDPIEKLRAAIPPDRLLNVLIGMDYAELEVKVLAGLDQQERAELLRAMHNSPGPKFWEQLLEERQYKWAAVAMQEGPCDACGVYHYNGEIDPPCPIPDPADRQNNQDDCQYDHNGEGFQHCACWYDCEPCCKCGADGVLIFGPVLPKFYYPEFPPATLAQHYSRRTAWGHEGVILTGDQIAAQQGLTTLFVAADEVDNHETS